MPFLGAIMSEAEAEAVCKTFVDRCYREIREKPKEELEDNEGEDLCNAEFSLAYGAPSQLYSIILLKLLQHPQACCQSSSTE